MLLVGHSLVSDLSMLVRNGFAIPNIAFFDTEIASRWLFAEQTDHSLEHLTLRCTNMGSWRKTLGKLDPDDFENLSDEELAQRCGGDAEAALRLYSIFDKEIKANGFTKAWDLAMSVLPILATIGGIGMAVNRKELQKRARWIGHWLKREKADLESVLSIANLDSHQQLASVLYGPFGAIPLHKTTQGYSTDRKSLMWARYQARQAKQKDLDTLLSRILDYGTQSKLQSTYYDGWLKELGSDNRIHSFYSLGRTSTGRLSSYKTNLQNVPNKARELIIPSPGYDLIVSADHKSLEWRIAAHISGDRTMCRWIIQDKDPHAIMAARVMGFPEPQTKTQFDQFKIDHPDERDIGKMSNFASLYGVSADSLAWQIFAMSEGTQWIPPPTVQQYINTFFATLNEYKQYTTELWYTLQRKEWILCPTGFKWLLPATPDGWRQAMNYPVQRTSSDIMLLGLKALFHELKRANWKSRIMGEVHDNVVLETTKQELPQLVKLLRYTCENPDTKSFGFKLSVPLALEVTAGPTWADLKPI